MVFLPLFPFQLADWCLLMRRKTSELDVVGGGSDSPCISRRGSEGPMVIGTSTTHRRKPFMEALYKAVELTAPEALDWTQEIVHLDMASRSKYECFFTFAV